MNRFFDRNMLQLVESRRFLADQMSPADRQALDTSGCNGGGGV
jgi:hypothetical protein